MAQGQIARARRWWTSTPRLIRRSSLVLLLLGSALVCAGLWLDHIDGWDGHDFLINLVSSLTSLCFGVPAAILIFSHLGNAQDEARQTTRSRTHTAQEIREFPGALLEPFNATDIATLVAQATSLRTDVRDLWLQRESDPASQQTRARAISTWQDLLSDPDERTLQHPGVGADAEVADPRAVAVEDPPFSPCMPSTTTSDELTSA